MRRLSYGKYVVIDEVLYLVRGNSASNNRNWVLSAIDSTAESTRREIPAGGHPGYKYISPSASYRGARLTDLVFQDDDRVLFSVWPYPRGWPADVPLQRYGMPERAGDGFWSGTIAFSELEDFDDGIPEEWRPFLPTNDVDDALPAEREGTVPRDARADQAYFDNVVEYLTTRCESNDRRLERPVEKWADPKWIGQVAGDAMRQRWDRFSALYSQGAAVEVLRAGFDTVLSDAERALRLAKEFFSEEQKTIRFRFNNNKDSYRERLALVALALALAVDDATFDRVVAAVEIAHGDQLVDRLIATRRPAHPVGEELAFPRVVGALNSAFEIADPSKTIEIYLKNWYTAWKGIWGWGGHLSIDKGGYKGYWAFEVLGVVVALGVDDAPFRSNEFYPADLLTSGSAGRH